jgi:Ca2+-binding EF-hand superfamily protein
VTPPGCDSVLFPLELQLSEEEFAQGLRDMGIDAPRRDVAALVLYFDTDRSGKISVDELQKGLAPPMPEVRLALVQEAFRRLDKTGDGVVKIDDLALAYDTSKHPLVKAGDMTPEQALTEFLGNFEGPDRDGTVTAAEFMEYYRGVSANIPLDDYFELMIRCVWVPTPHFPLPPLARPTPILLHVDVGATSCCVSAHVDLASLWSHVCLCVCGLQERMAHIRWQRLGREHQL